MVDHTQKVAPRPLSPFLTIFHWPVTMATSIIHRVTGVGLAGGMVLIAWWLFAVSNGPEPFGFFYRQALTPIGQIVLYGFAWALAYHFLNGIRHLFWDFGYGFHTRTADRTGILVIALSLLLTAGVFALIHAGYGGYYQ